MAAHKYWCAKLMSAPTPTTLELSEFHLFDGATRVTGIVVGARTTLSRFPTALILQGGDLTTGTGPSPEYTTLMTFGIKPFVSATKTGIILPTVQPTDGGVVHSEFDFETPSGIGRVPYDVKREILPATTPKTYTPQFAKVRLVRDIDGKVIREEWSDPTTGEGAFEDVDENYTYSVIAIYPSADFRAVIADRIEPEGYPG